MLSVPENSANHGVLYRINFNALPSKHSVREFQIQMEQVSLIGIASSIKFVVPGIAS